MRRLLGPSLWEPSDASTRQVNDVAPVVCDQMTLLLRVVPLNDPGLDIVNCLWRKGGVVDGFFRHCLTFSIGKELPHLILEDLESEVRPSVTAPC